MPSYIELRRQVSDAIATFEEAIAGDGPPAGQAFVQARVKLIQAVNSYISHLNVAVASSMRGDAATARWKPAVDDLLALRMTYSNHVARWTASNVTTDWRGYRESCATLVRGMQQHLALFSTYLDQPHASERQSN